MPPEEKTEQETKVDEKSPLSTAEQHGGDGDQSRSEKPVRPEGLADDYWNDETGVDLPKLLTDHKSLAEAKAAQDAAAAGKPQKAEDFKAVLPDDFEAPDGVQIVIDEKDPRLPIARELALEMGLDQAGFSKLLALDAKFKLAEDAQLKGRLTAELGHLGTRGKERVDAVTTWMGAKLGSDFANALAPMIFTAKQVQAFEKIIGLLGGNVPNFTGAKRGEESDGEISDEEYAAMSPTARINYAREQTAKKKAAGKAA